MILSAIGFLLGVTGQLTDCRTTEVAMKHGWAEMGPIADGTMKYGRAIATYVAKIFKTSFSTNTVDNAGYYLLYLIKALVLPMICLILGNLTLGTFAVWFYELMCGGAGAYAGYKNYKLMKQYGIKPFTTP
jgi:hypothetical protein